MSYHHKIKYKLRNFNRFIIAIIIFIIISNVIAGITLKKAIDNTKDIRRDECYLFSQNGKPVSLFAAGQLINYTNEENIPQIIKVTWSSWYRHILEDPCKFCSEVSINSARYCEEEK